MIRNLLIKLDLLTPPFKITYKGQRKVKTIVGSVLTMFLGIVTLFLGIFLSRDTFFKENPKTRINQFLASNSRIMLDDLVIPIGKLVNLAPNRAEFDKEFEIVPQIAIKDPKHRPINYSKRLLLRNCTAEDMEISPALQEIGISNINNVECIDLTKIINPDNTVSNENLFLSKKKGQPNSQIIEILYYRRKGRSTPLKAKYESNVLLPSISVNYSDYENPKVVGSQAFIFQLQQGLSPIYRIELAENTIKSDIGWFFPEYVSESFKTFVSSQIEYQLTDLPTQPYVSLAIETAKINTSFEREYLKLTTVLAEVSAIVKIVALIGNFLASTFSEYTLYARRIEVKEEIENSVNNLRKEKPVLPSFWEYLFTDSKKFKKEYPSRISCETDLNWIGMRIYELHSLRTNMIIPFRQT